MVVVTPIRPSANIRAKFQDGFLCDTVAVASRFSIPMETKRSFLMPRREMIIPKGMEKVVENFHYAPAVKVDNTLYISGQLGRDENLQVVEGAEAQYIQAFENLKKVLEAADATLENVVDLVTYHTDMRDIMRFLEVKNRYFMKDYPTWTAIGVPALSMPGLLVEIKATAVL
jgi:enamine deaminase RidA (YjgF/YER057c/UK114 family)